jgi:DNA-binding IclR family transcriptional regulator
LNVVQDLKGPDQEGVNVQKNQTSSGLAPKPHRPGAQSIERAMGLVNLVARHHDQGISLQAMVQLSGLDRTTAWRMLGSLQSANLVARDDHTGLYTLGVQATSWGAASLGQSALIRQCQPAMKTLARLSGDNVFLVLRLGDYSHCLHLEQGAHAISSFRQTVGETRLLGLGVASIAMLAVLDDTAIQAHHARHSAQYELEGVAYAQLQRWVQATRQRGHAYRSTAGIAAVGLHWHLGHAANAALSIGAARTRLPLARAAELATLMRNHCPQLVAPVSRIFPSL